MPVVGKPRDLVRLPVTVTPRGRVHRHARDRSGRLVSVKTFGGNLQVLLWETGSTGGETVAQTTTLVSGGVRGAALAPFRWNGLLLLYAQNDALYARESRSSGETWSSPVLIGSDFRHVTQWPNGQDDLHVAMAWRPSDSTWYVLVATPDAAGALTWSGPVAVASGLSGGAELRREATRWYRFSYIDLSGNAQLLTCKELGPDGSGTWS